MTNRPQERLDEHLASTKGIEKFVLRALEKEEKERERARQERTPSRAHTPSNEKERGVRLPSPPPDDPDESVTVPSVNKPPSPRPPPGGFGESVDASDPTPLRVPPAAADLFPHELVEEIQPQSLPRTSYGVSRRSPTPPPEIPQVSLPSPPPTVPSGNGVLVGKAAEEAQPQGPPSPSPSPSPSPEVRQHSPVPPSIAVQLVDDLLRDQRVQEARPPGPSSHTSLKVERRNSPAPPPLPPPQAPLRRRRPRRSGISEEKGYRPADVKNYTTNTTTRDVSPPRTHLKEEGQQSPPQGRSMRLARDQRQWESQARGKKGMWQAHVEDAPPSPPLEETRRGPALEEDRLRSSRGRRGRRGAPPSSPHKNERIGRDGQQNRDVEWQPSRNGNAGSSWW